MNLDSIGIVCQGFVGTAMRVGMQKFMNVNTYDKYLSEKSNCKDLIELCARSGVIFVCLPTPMLANGECDLSIVKQTILKK